MSTDPIWWNDATGLWYLYPGQGGVASTDSPDIALFDAGSRGFTILQPGWYRITYIVNPLGYSGGFDIGFDSRLDLRHYASSWAEKERLRSAASSDFTAPYPATLTLETVIWADAQDMLFLYIDAGRSLPESIPESGRPDVTAFLQVDRLS